MMDNIFRKIEESKELIIQIQKELTSRIAIGPENGGDGEHDKTLYMKELLVRLEPDTVYEIKAPDKRVSTGYRPNLLIRWNKKISGPVIWVLVHSDVVPPGNPSLWSGDPFKIRVKGDMIIGRGVEDNQHAFISFYLALKSILEIKKGILPSPVGIVIVADEETGSEYGLRYILKNHRDIFKKEDIIIVPDGGNRAGTMIEVAEKSMLWLKFNIIGTQCHASTPDKGRNSLCAAASLIMELERLKKMFPLKDPLFDPPYSTFEPTKIEENVKNINTIPGQDTFYMDSRILPSYNIDDIIEKINWLAKMVSQRMGVKIEVQTVYRLDAPEPTPKDAQVVKILSKAIENVKGKKAEIKGIGGGTVAAFFRKKGLPAVVWSTVSDTAHKPDEYCLISNIIEDAKVFAYIMMHRPGSLIC